MDVQLYVYDLSRGMARAMSQQITGIQIDAVYHTAVVFGQREYFFAQGVQVCYPGSTPHGQPMQIVPLGKTEIDLETILDYLECLKQVYTAASYDLFEHNCNNFSNDFSMFLVGKNIPEHITNLPKRVLETPFGQMLRPQIDGAMRSITQAPVAPLPPVRASSLANGSVTSSTLDGNASRKKGPFGKVINANSSSILDKILPSATNTMATIFFTSATCAPCKLAYPMFDQLADEFRDALFVKVDIEAAPDVAFRYQIRATPTFMTFVKGEKNDEWSGADPNLLKTNVQAAMQHNSPSHPHSSRSVPLLQNGDLRSVTYARIPPLDKLTGKLGSASRDPIFTALRLFIDNSQSSGRANPLPDLNTIGKGFLTKMQALPIDARFAAVDLLRCAMLDPRASGFFAEHRDSQIVPAIVTYVNELAECPHNLRLVTIHLSCNIFSSSLYVKEILRRDNNFAAKFVQLISSSLLDNSHPTTRVAAASLAFNFAVANYRVRREEGQEALDESLQVELGASLVETLSSERNADAVKSELRALGYLLHYASPEGELADLCKALDGRTALMASGEHLPLAKEVASLI